MSEAPGSGTRRSVTLSDELWQRIANYRHEKRIDRFSEAFRQVVEAGLAKVEAEIAQRKKGRRSEPLKMLAYLAIGLLLATEVTASVCHPDFSHVASVGPVKEQGEAGDAPGWS